MKAPERPVQVRNVSQTCRWWIFRAPVGLILSTLALPAHAQAVLGRTVAASTGAPLAGVFVSLVDADGRRAAGFLSRADGTFLIQAPAPGSYRLKAELIGYRSIEQGIELESKETARETLRLPLEAVQLDGVVARASRERNCALRPDEGNALTRLWSEAQKALRIAEWAEDSGWLRADVYTYQRVLKLTDLEVLGEASARAGSRERSAFVAADLDKIESEGFVVAGDGGTIYRGADAELLLSDWFMRTHCFGIRKHPSERLVGISFEPGPERKVPDIKGVLWLDAETAHLKRLEYAWTEYPVNYPLPLSRFGGRTEFRHLPGGGVAVERWWVRMPTLGYWADGAALRSVRRCGMAACEDGETLRTLSRAGLAVEEEGGGVHSFRFADGTELPAAERAGIKGEQPTLHLILLRLTVQEQQRVTGHMPVRVDPRPLIPDPRLVEVADDAFAAVPAAEISTWRRVLGDMEVGTTNAVADAACEGRFPPPATRERVEGCPAESYISLAISLPRDGGAAWPDAALDGTAVPGVQPGDTPASAHTVRVIERTVQPHGSVRSVWDYVFVREGEEWRLHEVVNLFVAG